MTEFLALFFVILLVYAQSLHYTRAFPLSRQGRWIVDDATGKRTKLACVNWASHLEPMVAEGLNKQPIDSISKAITSMGFNCVRLTWPLYLATDESLADVTVGQSFQTLGLTDSLAGVKWMNPEFVHLGLMEAYKAVVSNLASNNIMVILDNHISKPGWCCDDDDNGFFGDLYFNPDDWIKGLTRMATIFNNFTNVVGMSLRNELRGVRVNIEDWFRYMRMGAEAVRSANPNVLVILSGLNYDTDLSHLADRNLDTNVLDTKLVFEMHWYSFTDHRRWSEGDPSCVCEEITWDVQHRGAFLVDRGWPLFVSEWGGDQGGSGSDDHYLDCVVMFLAAGDFDWAIWSLQGTYYVRNGVHDYNEPYGVLNTDWFTPRNREFLKRIAAIQPPSQPYHDSIMTRHDTDTTQEIMVLVGLWCRFLRMWKRNELKI